MTGVELRAFALLSCVHLLHHMGIVMSMCQTVQAQLSEVFKAAVQGGVTFFDTAEVGKLTLQLLRKAYVVSGYCLKLPQLRPCISCDKPAGCPLPPCS